MVVLALALARAGTPTDPISELEAVQISMYERVAPSVVYIVTATGVGSGFVVGPDGLLVTSAHVVGDADVVDVVTFRGQRLAGRVVERAVGVDAALIQVDAVKLPALRLSQDAPRVGQWVASVGHGRGGGWTFTTGMVTNSYVAENGQAVLQTQIPVNRGNSGGPVLDRSGNVVGIVTAGIEDAQAMNFAIRIDVIQRSLERLRSSCECLVVEAPAGVLVFVDGAAVGTGPRVYVPLTPGTHEAFAIIGGKKVARTVTWPDTREVTLAEP